MFIIHHWLCDPWTHFFYQFIDVIHPCISLTKLKATWGQDFFHLCIRSTWPATWLQEMNAEVRGKEGWQPGAGITTCSFMWHSHYWSRSWKFIWISTTNGKLLCQKQFLKYDYLLQEISLFISGFVSFTFSHCWMIGMWVRRTDKTFHWDKGPVPPPTFKVALKFNQKGLLSHKDIKALYLKSSEL